MGEHLPAHPFALMEVKNSTVPGAGLGAFAVRDLLRGTLLGECRGKLTDKYSEINPHYSWTWKDHQGKIWYRDTYDYPINNPNRYILGDMTKEQKEMVNTEMIHTDTRVYYFTIKDVKGGSELVISYGPSYNWNTI